MEGQTLCDTDVGVVINTWLSSPTSVDGTPTPDDSSENLRTRIVVLSDVVLKVENIYCLAHEIGKVRNRDEVL